MNDISISEENMKLIMEEAEKRFSIEKGEKFNIKIKGNANMKYDVIVNGEHVLTLDSLQ